MDSVTVNRYYVVIPFKNKESVEVTTMAQVGWSGLSNLGKAGIIITGFWCIRWCCWFFLLLLQKNIKQKV